MAEIRTDRPDQVTVRVEPMTIPTYRVGAPEKNPMFLEKRVYQGSSGVVYPYPIIERVFDEKVDVTYTTITLENRYLQIMLLPELGGRVQMALDKTNNYHFVYYNQVIKPALVGLTGPWLSGGIEFNWPQHHRPSTFEPVDYRIEANADGSQTVWFSELERMSRTKGMAGFTLYPDRAYLEIAVQLYNRTPLPQTFLWWANPAVAVNDEYQSVFPPDVHAVMDHGKRDVSEFPIARGVYYKHDYAPGTDISRYKNIPVPTSYMAYHSDFDFLGCYDHGKQAGMMHVADHHVVPGKKQWTWGNGDFGRAWDRQLTDTDGPYIELMCGAYTDNQPDFSWLQPGEEKRFMQIFMPYKDVGAATNANQDAVIRLTVADGCAQIGVYLSSPRHVTVQLVAAGQIVYTSEADLDPTTSFSKMVILSASITAPQLTLRVVDNGRELIAFTPLADTTTPIPEAARAAPLPAEIESNEALYLNGLHLEQYRHATFAPEPYYLEALRRDPLDSRCNNALGLLLLRSGQFSQAEPYFRRAVESLTRRNPNPYDGEPFYNLGLTLLMQGSYVDAYNAFYKAAWSAAWQDSAYFELACLDCRNGDWERALTHIEHALTRNTRHHRARHARIVILQLLGREQDARIEITHSLILDRFNFGTLYELERLDGDSGYADALRANPKGTANIMLETALDYAHLGLFIEAATLLAEPERPAHIDPLLHYMRGWCLFQDGDPAAADAAFAQASALSPDYCFPNQIECVPALQLAMQRDPTDARAPYYLGNFWYAHRQYQDAITCWEHSRRLDEEFPTVHRNLGVAYMNKRHDAAKAQIAYERAFALNNEDARVFFELDQLYKMNNEPPAARLARLEQHRPLVDQRDDLTLERIALLNLTGHYNEALAILTTRNFHPWEGGEGKTAAQYVFSLVELAKWAIDDGAYAEAITLLERARIYPPNLGEGKLSGAHENQLDYYQGCAYRALKQEEHAQHYFTAASAGQLDLVSPRYYNDQPPELIFYQGCAYQELGQIAQAHAISERMIDYGRVHVDDVMQPDYFAVSLPDFVVFEADLSRRNRLHCHILIALGAFGLGDVALCELQTQAVLTLDAYNQPMSMVMRSIAKNGKGS